MADAATVAPPADDLSGKLDKALAASTATGDGKPPVDYSRVRAALGLDAIDSRLAAEDRGLDTMKEGMAFPKLTAPPPTQPQTDPLQAFGQPAMYLAVFGSLLTRRPLSTAVMSAANVLKSTAALDAAGAQRAYDEWKVQSENATKLANYELAAYRAALSDKHNTLLEKAAALRTAAAVFKNPNLVQILDDGGVESATGYVNAYGKHVDDVGKTTDALHQHVTAAFEKSSPAQAVAPAGAAGRRQLVAQAIDSDDPKIQAQGIDLLAKDLESGQTGKVPASERAKMELTLTKLAKISADLRSSDPSKVEAARKEASEIPEIGPGLLSTARPQHATSGSVSAERETRFRELKTADPSLSDSAAWDKVNHDMFLSKTAQFPPGTAEMLADRAIAGDFSGLTGFGRSPQLLSQLDSALTKRMAEHDPPLTGADLARIKINFAAYAQGVKAFEAGGKLEPTVRSLNVVTQHLDTLAEAARALSQNDMPALNAIQNTLATELGMTGPVTFDALKGIVAAEIEKAVTGSAGAVTDREDLKANLNKSLNAGQLADVISGYEHLMAGQIAGLSQSYNRAQELGGAKGGDFDQKFLSAKTRAVVSGQNGGSGSVPALPPKDKLIVGHEYPTARGLATWDGEHFIPVK